MSNEDFISAYMKAAREAVLANSPQLRLGQIIDLCKAINAVPYENGERLVYFDFEYLHPTGIDSWRGIYAELALSFSGDRAAMSLHRFIDMLERADGADFEGYKGGTFRMSRQTPVWVANYGNSGNTAVVGIKDAGYQVIVQTAYCEA